MTNCFYSLFVSLKHNNFNVNSQVKVMKICENRLMSCDFNSLIWRCSCQVLSELVLIFITFFFVRVVGDLHGDLKQARSALEMAGVLSSDGQDLWTGGENVCLLYFK
jgi:hypothetical protein